MKMKRGGYMYKKIRSLFQKSPRYSERELYDRYYDDVYRLAFFISRDKELTQDIVQDTFIKIFAHMDQVKEEEKIESWIKTITRRTTFDHLKKQKKWNEYEEMDVLLDKGIGNQTISTEKEYEEEEIKEIIIKAMNELKPDFRIILYFKYIEGYTTIEIAKELDVKEGTVKSRLHRAKEALKAEIKKGGVEDESNG